MSETVDTRVVRMEFDNKQFEKNIKKTSQSLEDLKQNLDFKGIGNSLDEVKLKISALEITVTTFIATIAHRITDLGIKMVKALSVDNISSGWVKFGEKTTSVATMMAQKIRIAGQEITDLGLKTEVVNKQLELLNWFSDETSYSFNDMVNSVGKFTAAGQDLDVSVKAMEGIATWAALSGQNAQTASRAMYQLAQAMGKGKIQKIDWMSIQNANMDTEEFRATILDTAVALGQLTKEGNKFITKTGKKFTQAQFADMLSEGWFTSDVLVKGLNKYSAAVEQIYEISEREGITASEVIEEYGNTLDEFGVKAFKAAQEARTFLDVINSVKDAVSSKWMSTFEAVFGSEAEAVKLWTDLANELYDVFAESGNFRNDILSVWKELGGRDDLFARGGENQGAFWNIYDAIIAVRDLIKSAWNTIFPLSELEEYSSQVEDIGNKFKSITKRIREFTERLQMSEATGLRLSKIFQGLFNILKVGINIVRSIRFIIDPLIEVGKELINQVLDQVIYYGGKFISVGSRFESVVIRIRDLLVDFLEVLNPTGILGDLFGLIQKVFNIVSNYRPITRLVEHVSEFINSLKETTSLKEDLSNFFDMLRSAFTLISRLGIQVITILFKILPVVSKILNIIFKLLGYIAGVLSKVIGFVSKLIKKFLDFLSQNQMFERIKNSIVEFLKAVYTFLTPLINLVTKAAVVIGNFIKNVILTIPRILGIATNAIANSNLVGYIAEVLNGVIFVIKDFIKTVGKASGGISGGLAQAFRTLIKGFLIFIKSMIPLLQILLRSLGKLLEAIGTVITKIANTILNILNGQNVGNIFKIVILLGIVLTAFMLIYNLLWLITSIIKPISVIADSLSGALDALATRLYSSVLNNVANSIIKMAIALALISSINEEALLNALSAVIILMGVIYGITKAIQNMANSIKAVQKLRLITGVMRQIAFILIGAGLVLKLLSNIPENDLYRAVGVASGILASMYALVGILIIIQKFVSKNAAVTFSLFTSALITFSIAMVILSEAIKILSRIDIGKVWNGYAFIAAFTALMIFTSRAVSVTSSIKFAAFSASLILFAIAMSLMVGSISILTLLDVGKVWNGIAVIAVFTGLMVSITKLTSLMGSVSFMIFSAALIAFGLAMEIMAGVISTLSLLEYSKVWNGVAVIGAFLAIVALAIKLIGIFSAVNFGIFAVSLGLFGGAMLIMSKVISILGSMDSRLLWKAIGAITALTAGIVVLASIMQLTHSALSLIALSVGMTIFAVAMVPFVSALLLLGDVNIKQLGTGLLVMAASLLVLIAVAAIAKPLITTILALSAAMLLAGVGMLAMGMGLTVLATGIEAIALALVTKFEAMKDILITLATLVTEVLFAAIKTAVDRLTELLPPIFNMISILLDNLIELLFSKGPAIIELVITILDTLLKAVADHGESIFTSIFKIIQLILTKLTENIGPIADKLLTILLKVIDKLIEFTPQIIEKVINFLVVAVKALFKNIGKLLDVLVDNLFDFITKVLVSLTKKVVAIAGLLAKVILIIISAAIKIVTASLGSLSKLFTAFIGGLLLVLLHTFMGMTRVVVEVFKTIVKEAISLLIDVITWAFPALALVGRSILKAIMSGLLSMLTESFMWAVELVDKIFNTNFVKKIESSVGGLADALADDARKAAQKLGGGLDAVQEELNNASNNITGVVSMTINAAGEAVSEGIDQINGAVGNAINQLGDSLEVFGKKSGNDIMKGIEEGVNEDEANKIGQDIGNSIEEGFASATETHSPSRVFIRLGGYLMKGLGLGIKNSEQEASDVMAGVITRSLAIANDIINDQSETDLVIKVGMDISNVEAQSAKIQDIMSGINNPSITAAGANADYNSRAMARKSSSTGNINGTTTNNNSNDVTYNNVFNITSTDPAESAEEIDRILQQQAIRKKLAHGV